MVRTNKHYLSPKLPFSQFIVFSIVLFICSISKCFLSTHYVPGPVGGAGGWRGFNGQPKTNICLNRPLPSKSSLGGREALVKSFHIQI